MSRHQPELDAVAYVTGILSDRERRRFERHLLECETCWEEVRLDREGRRLAESGRSVAPPELREAIRAAVADAAVAGDPATGHAVPRPRPGERRHGRARLALRPALALVLSILVLGGAAMVLRPAAEPPPIQAALVAYQRSEVVGAHENMPMPDLSPVGLRPEGAEHMALVDMPVEAFAYRTEAGSRLTLFMAHAPFPRATGWTSDVTGTWRAERQGIEMLSGSSPAPYLALTDEPALLDQLADALASGQVDIA